MSLVYLGSLDVGTCLPGVHAPLAAAQSGLQAALPDLQARVTALNNFAPSVGVGMPDFLALAQSILASVEGAIAAGIQPPTVDAQIGQVGALAASLGTTLGGININLNTITAALTLLAAVGVHAYAYDGTRDDFISELATIDPPGTTGASHTNAIVLLTTVGATWSAMSQLFRVTP
jgi:hypothetical protein